MRCRVRIHWWVVLAMIAAGCAAPPPTPTSTTPPAKPTAAQVAAPTAASVLATPAAPAKTAPAAGKPSPTEPTPVPGSVEAVLTEINRLPADERAKRLEEGARKEGKVIVYGAINFEQEEELLGYFRRKYAFLQVEYVRGRTPELLQRALTESRARRLGADFLVFPAAEMYVLQQAKVFARYRSPELSAMREGFFDPEGFWAVRHTIPKVLAYNTKLVPASEAPKRFEDLLDPKWKDKLGLAQPDGPRLLATLDAVYGEARAKEIVKSLVAQNPVWPDSNTSLANALARGEVAVAEVLSTSLDAVRQQGNPVDSIFPDPIVLQIDGIGIAGTAPHPHAAALLVDWQLSKEGQETNSRIAPRIGGRTDVKYPNSDVIQTRKLVVQTPELVGTHYEKYSKQYADLFAR